MAKNVSPFCSLVCKLFKYIICLLGALLHRNTVIDFLMNSVLGCDSKRVNVICS